MTELLIIKAKESYYRFTDDGYLPCEMNKGSVFPLEQVDKAKRLCAALQQDGIADASLIKLTIIEEPYVER
ncbi:MAG: hypothetical protein BA866_09480 [Desulfobulbaceae bacterium S5133MH15]|nr:MAG: hypothetical protein BA866_09480 [Desulfobulbaceae bacterium S5133MH15]